MTLYQIILTIKMSTEYIIYCANGNYKILSRNFYEKRLNPVFEWQT